MSKSVRGVIRTYDSLGRVSIPREMCRALGIQHSDMVEIWGGTDPDGHPCIYVRKYRPGCYVCGADFGPFLTVKDIRICQNCSDEIDQQRKEAQK